MTRPAVRVLFAGGGTGGHVFPAIRIARYLKDNWGADCLFIGTRHGLESTKVPQAGFLLRHIWISGFRRSFSPGNLLFPLKLLVSLWQSKKWLHWFRPDLVVGTGGYVAGPVLRQAIKMKIPTAIQEQNSYPGVTTRLLAKQVDQVFIAYEEALQRLGEVKSYKFVGNPMGEDFTLVDRREALRFFELENGLPVLLCFGGSQGAKGINRVMAQFLRNNQGIELQLIWQTGQAELKIWSEEFNKGLYPGVRIFPFIDKMNLAYCAADLAVCRAGAMTLSELAATGLPAVLIPYPYSAADHQLKNARTIAQGGAAVIVEEKAGFEEQFNRSIMDLFRNPDLVSDMSNKMKKFHRPEATAEIAESLYKLLEEKGKLN